MVDSSATTARPSPKARATSSERTNSALSVTNSSLLLGGQNGARLTENPPGKFVAGGNRLDRLGIVQYCGQKAGRKRITGTGRVPHVVDRAGPDGHRLVAIGMDLGRITAVLDHQRRTGTDEFAQGTQLGFGSVGEDVRRAQGAEQGTEGRRTDGVDERDTCRVDGEDRLLGVSDLGGPAKYGPGRAGQRVRREVARVGAGDPRVR